MKPLVPILAVCLLLLACSGNDSSTDAGFDASDDGGMDAGQDAGGDAEPGPEFSLLFESGAQACSGFSEDRTAAQELALGARLRFVAQTIQLPGDSDFFEADLLESVELGPQGLVASPTGPGEFSHSFEEEIWGWCHRYIFSQSYTFDDPPRPWRVEAEFEFCRRDAEDDPFELVFDADQVGEAPRSLQASKHQVRIRGFVDQGEDYLTEKQFFRSCSYAMDEAQVFSIHLVSADESVDLTLEKRWVPPVWGSGEAAAVAANVTIDGDQQSMDSPLHLAYRAELHNLNEGFLVVLDPPLGAVHGLHWQETGEDTPPAVVELLDGNLDPEAPIESKTVGVYTLTPSPSP